MVRCTDVGQLQTQAKLLLADTHHCDTGSTPCSQVVEPSNANTAFIAMQMQRVMLLFLVHTQTCIMSCGRSIVADISAKRDIGMPDALA